MKSLKFSDYAALEICLNLTMSSSTPALLNHTVNVNITCLHATNDLVNVYVSPIYLVTNYLILAQHVYVQIKYFIKILFVHVSIQ